MHLLIWIAFLLLIAALIALDLGVFHRRAHVIRVREALGWTLLWVAAALVFNVGVYWLYRWGWMGVGVPGSGREAAIQFFTGYLVEKSLSVDNIFVIAVIFAYFRIPVALQHRVLFWGILGAVILRGAMIAMGTALIAAFDWITYVFGALLLFSAYKMMSMDEETVDPQNNPLIRLTRRFFPVTSTLHDQRFLVRVEGRLAATPMLLALLVVESSDVMFAVDSIPAVFAVTRDPFIVFTSNIFAILGLRSLYFAVAGLMDMFRYLKTSLVVLLAYIGVKMLISHYFEIPNLVSLAIITAILAVGVLASLIFRRHDAPPGVPSADASEASSLPSEPAETTTP